MSSFVEAEAFRTFQPKNVATATVGDVVATDALVVNGVTFTAVDADDDAVEFLVGEDNAETAANLAAKIAASTNAAIKNIVSVDLAGTVLTITVTALGQGPVALSQTGNHITLSDATINSLAVDDPALRIARKGRKLFGIGTLAPTAAVDTGIIDTAGLSEIVVTLLNGNTSQTRTPTFKFIDESGTEMDSLTAAAALAANTRGRYVVGTGSTGTGVTYGYAFPPAPKFRVTIPAPASGTGNGSLYIWGR